MNEMIERYIYDVTRRLPESERGEIGRELEASISDMLPDDPSERDVIDALTELGAPRILAERYRQKPRYLISPAMFELYLWVLKLVTAIVAGALAFIGGMNAVSSGSIGMIIQSAITMAVDGALQAAFWITVGFAIADRYSVKQKAWSIGDLPRLSERKGVKIPRSSTIVEMILSAFFSSLIVYMIISGKWFYVWKGGAQIINPFSQAALNRALPYVILCGCMALVVNGMKLYWARWNLPLCIANAVYNLVWLGIALYLLHWPDLFSGEIIAFVSKLAEEIDGFGSVFMGGAVVVISAILCIVVAIEIGVSVWHTWKGSRASVQLD